MKNGCDQDPTHPALSVNETPAILSRFLELPTEIRREIYRLAIEPAQVAFFNADVVARPPPAKVRVWNALAQVCRESRTEYLQVRCLRWISYSAEMTMLSWGFWYKRFEIAADPVNDLLVVSANKLPRLDIPENYAKAAPEKEPGDNSACRFPHCLSEVPIQRLLNKHALFGYTWDRERYEGFSEFPALPRVDNVLDLRRFPSLREYYSTYRICGSDWWLTGYQVQGPHVTSNLLPSENRWSMETRDETLGESMKHFNGKSIVGDTGILWKGQRELDWPQDSLFFDCAFKKGDATVEDLPHEDLTPEMGPLEDLTPEELAFEHFKNQKRKKLNEINTLYTPFIGFRGYSETPTSLGGHWAGFRYFTENRRVEFSPMSWDEVNRYGLGVPEGGPLPIAFPEMVVKIYVIRPGDTPPQLTHHFWQNVPAEEDWSEEDGEEMKKIRRIWDIVSFEFNGLGHFDWFGYWEDPGNEKYKQPLDLEKPIESDVWRATDNGKTTIDNLKLYTGAEIAEEISAGLR